MGSAVVKKKLTLSIRSDLISEVKKIAAEHGESLSNIVEKYLEYLAFIGWIDALAEDLGLGPLEPTDSSEIPGSRPKGLDAARLVRELRSKRSERITLGGV